jgi:ATP synthase F1 epsilon subunit
MEDNFKFEIITPEKIIYSDNVKMVKVPSYEGDMSILKNHIPTISFLRPGIVKIEKNDGNTESFFTQDGTVEFFNNNLILLSAFIENVKKLSKEFFDELEQNVQKKLEEKEITDQDRYLLNHKLETIKEIRI